MKLIAEIGERTVYWNLDDNVGAVILQTFVQALGPASEDSDSDGG